MLQRLRGVGERMQQFKLFADYFQFILMDEQSDDDFAEIWTDEALDRGLAMGHSAICPCTLCIVDVVVEVDVLNSCRWRKGSRR